MAGTGFSHSRDRSAHRAVTVRRVRVDLGAVVQLVRAARIICASLKAFGETAAQPETVSEPVSILLTLASEHTETGPRRLDLRLTGFPYAWLHAFACSMSAHPEPRAQTRQID